METGEKIKFTTESNGKKKIWSWHGPKKGGAVGAGKYGGFYVTGEGQTRQKALIKQDKRIELNIAEFLAGRIYQKLIPEASAVIHFAKVPGSGKDPDPDGSNVYLVSEFIPNWNGGIYEDMGKILKGNAELSQFMVVESAQLFLRLISTGFLERAFEAAKYRGFGRIMPPGFLTNNPDYHLSNVGVLGGDGDNKDLAIIDYGFSYRAMDNKINPHSFTKLLPTHAVRTEGWNNFMFYPEDQKINVEFVAGLDEAIVVDLDDTFEEAFREISQFYGVVPIEKFALRTGLINKNDIANLKQHNQEEQKYKALLVEELVRKLQENNKARQQDLSRFSAQIKCDLCLKFQGEGWNIEGFINYDNQDVTFQDVVLQHREYFLEVLTGKEKFKLRQTAHKRNFPTLANSVKDQAGRILAQYVLLDKALKSKCNIQKIDDALDLIKSGTITQEILNKVIADHKNKAITFDLSKIHDDKFREINTSYKAGYSDIDIQKIKNAKNLEELLTIEGADHFLYTCLRTQDPTSVIVVELRNYIINDGKDNYADLCSASLQEPQDLRMFEAVVSRVIKQSVKEGSYELLSQEIIPMAVEKGNQEFLGVILKELVKYKARKELINKVAIEIAKLSMKQEACVEALEKIWEIMRTMDDKRQFLGSSAGKASIYENYLKQKGVIDFKKFTANTRLEQVEVIMEQSQKYKYGTIEKEALKLLYKSITKDLKIDEANKSVVKEISDLESRLLLNLLRRDKKFIKEDMEKNSTQGNEANNNIILCLDFDSMEKFYKTFQEAAKQMPDLFDSSTKLKTFYNFVSIVTNWIRLIIEKLTLKSTDKDEAIEKLNKFFEIKVSVGTEQPLSRGSKEDKYPVKGLLEKSIEYTSKSVSHEKQKPKGPGK